MWNRVVGVMLCVFVVCPVWAVDSTIVPRPVPASTPKVLIVASATTQVDTNSCVWFDPTLPTSSWGPLIIHACFSGGAGCVGTNNHSGSNRTAYTLACPNGMVVDQVAMSSRTQGGTNQTMEYFDIRANVRCCNVTTTYTYRWADIPPPCSATRRSDCLTP